MNMQINITHTGVIAMALVGHGAYCIMSGNLIRGLIEISIGTRMAAKAGSLVTIIYLR